MKKIIFLVTIFLLFSCGMSAEVYALSETHEVFVYLYQDYNDCLFFVNWENTDKTASIRLESPDGKTITANSSNTVYYRGGAEIKVKTAESGGWSVYVTGDDLGAICVSGGNASSDDRENRINSFDAQLNGDSVKFSWDINSTGKNVSINIDSICNNMQNTVLWDYTAKSKDYIDIPIDQLRTGFCQFTLYYSDNGQEYSLTTDESLYVTYEDAPEKLNNINIGSINGKIYATWDAVQNSWYEIDLYDYDTMELIRSETSYTNYYTTNEIFDRLKISISAIDENNYYLGKADIYDITVAQPDGTVIFPEYSVTRDSTVSVDISCSSGNTVGFYLDNVLVLENAEAGQYNVSMTEGAHNITAFIKDQYGNMKTFVKEITVDKTAPVLTLNSEEQFSVSSDSVIVDGSVEPGATVAINGIEQESAYGNFSARVALANGSNQIMITAYDTAGNKSVKTITVDRYNSSIDLSWLIIPIILTAVLICWYIFLNKKGQKEKTSDEKSN